jgi:dUTP pyrophosphatase
LETQHERRRQNPDRRKKIQVRIMRLPHAADLPLPAYQSAHAAGLDLLAAVPAGAPIIIAPGARAAIPTGLALVLPPNIEGQIRSRSGLALHFGVAVLNSPGTLDADYRGEVHVILVNLGPAPFAVERGARIVSRQPRKSASMKWMDSATARVPEASTQLGEGTESAARTIVGRSASGRGKRSTSSRRTSPIAHRPAARRSMLSCAAISQLRSWSPFNVGFTTMEERRNERQRRPRKKRLRD